MAHRGMGYGLSAQVANKVRNFYHHNFRSEAYQSNNDSWLRNETLSWKEKSSHGSKLFSGRNFPMETTKTF
jgi:hypothetical protein